MAGSVSNQMMKFVISLWPGLYHSFGWSNPDYAVIRKWCNCGTSEISVVKLMVHGTAMMR